MKSRIHVNQHVIKRNREHGEDSPPISVKRGGKVLFARRVQILGDSVVVYQPDRPLSCGARVWVETEADIVVE